MRSRPGRPQPGSISRRSFLKLTAVFGLAAYDHRARISRLSLSSPLPLPVPYHFQPDPDALLARSLAAFDLLLVPAYVAAELIVRRALLPLTGPRGRAHDPEGAFTVPYAYAIGALVHWGPRAPQLAHGAWAAEALWPAWPRLVVGTALQACGCSPNEAHAGRLAQAGQSLAGWRPRLAADPLGALKAGQTNLAYVPLPLNHLGEPQLPTGAGWLLPSQGSLLIEYDWVIPAGSLDPGAVRALVAELTPQVVAPPAHAPARLVPLAPLPEAARAHHAGLWASLTSALQ